MDLLPYWRAFTWLHARRSCQWQPDPISGEAIVAWCVLEDVTSRSERRNVRVAVAMLDDVWIKRQRERRR